LTIGKRLQKEFIDKTEHGGVAADAQRQRENRSQSESRFARHSAQGISDIVNEIVHSRPFGWSPHPALRATLYRAELAKLGKSFEQADTPPSRRRGGCAIKKMATFL